MWVIPVVVMAGLPASCYTLSLSLSLSLLLSVYTLRTADIHAMLVVKSCAALSFIKHDQTNICGWIWILKTEQHWMNQNRHNLSSICVDRFAPRIRQVQGRHKRELCPLFTPSGRSVSSSSTRPTAPFVNTRWKVSFTRFSAAMSSQRCTG